MHKHFKLAQQQLSWCHPRQGCQRPKELLCVVWHQNEEKTTTSDMFI